MNISRKVSCLLLSGALLFAGFSATAQAAELLVSGAASLTNAFNEMKDAFQKKYPDVKVNTNYAASNPLLKQMETGAPVDVFASADQMTRPPPNGSLTPPPARTSPSMILCSSFPPTARPA